MTIDNFDREGGMDTLHDILNFPKSMRRKKDAENAYYASSFLHMQGLSLKKLTKKLINVFLDKT